MINPMVAAVLVAVSVVQQTDTVIPVSRGIRLEVVNLAGDVAVRSWNRDAVRVAARHSERETVVVRTNASVLRVQASARRGPQRLVDFEVSVPSWMPVRINGTFSDVSIEGTEGDVAVETVRGDVVVRGGDGLITLRSVEGSISVEGGRGRMDLYTVNDGIRVTGATGDISAETVNGSVTLQGIQSNVVDVGTVNGNLSFDGTIRDAGRYRFAAHNGNITLAVAERANATVNVATLNGRFEAAFPVTLPEARRPTRFEFTLGTGSARIDLHTFNGTVRLVRPGAAPARRE